MADVTNAGTPAAGGQLSGEASRAAAIKRLQKQREQPLLGEPRYQPPPAAKAPGPPPAPKGG